MFTDTFCSLDENGIFTQQEESKKCTYSSQAQDIVLFHLLLGDKNCINNKKYQAKLHVP